MYQCLSLHQGLAGKLEHFYDALEDGVRQMLHWRASLFHFKELEIREEKQYRRERGVSVTSVEYIRKEGK